MDNRRHLQRGHIRPILDGVALILVAAIVIAFAALAQARQFSTNGAVWGFGPGWDCTYPGKGDPVCVKSPHGR